MKTQSDCLLNKVATFDAFLALMFSLISSVLSKSDCTYKSRALFLKCKTNLQTQPCIQENIPHISNLFSCNDVPLHINCLLFHVRNLQAAPVKLRAGVTEGDVHYKIKSMAVQLLKLEKITEEMKKNDCNY